MSDLDLLDGEVALGRMTAESVVTGGAPPAEQRPPCAHDETVLTDTLVAFIKNDEGVTVEWQMRVRAECGGCNTKFLIAPTGRVPRDGGPGVVVALAPMVDEAPDLSAFGGSTDGPPASDEPVVG